jgi:hypothetical protein
MSFNMELPHSVQPLAHSSRAFPRTAQMRTLGLANGFTKPNLSISALTFSALEARPALQKRSLQRTVTQLAQTAFEPVLVQMRYNFDAVMDKHNQSNGVDHSGHPGGGPLSDYDRGRRIGGMDLDDVGRR